MPILMKRQNFSHNFIPTQNHMVFILDGYNSEHVAHAWIKICLFGQEKIRFVTAPDQIKCLKLVEYQRHPDVRTYF